MKVQTEGVRRGSRRSLINTKHLGAAVVSALGVGAVEATLPQAAAAFGCRASAGGASTYNVWARYAYCYFSPDHGTNWTNINTYADGYQHPVNEARNESGYSAVIQACYQTNRHYCGTPHTGFSASQVVSHFSYVVNSQISAKAWNGPHAYMLLWAWAEWGRHG